MAVVQVWWSSCGGAQGMGIVSEGRSRRGRRQQQLWQIEEKQAAVAFTDEIERKQAAAATFTDEIEEQGKRTFELAMLPA